MAAEQPDSAHIPEPWQPRFGLGSMMLVMFVLCVMASAGYYVVRGMREGRSFQLTFLLFTLTAPVLLLVAVSLFATALRFLQHRNRPK